MSQEGLGITSTTVLKDTIQSVGVIGGVSSEKPDSTEFISDVDDVSTLYQ